MTYTGTPLQFVADFVLSTGAYHTRGDGSASNVAGLNNYEWYKAWRYRKTVKGGAGLDIPMMFEGGDTFEDLEDAQFRVPKRKDVLFKAFVDWAKNGVHTLWVEGVLKKNTGFDTAVKYGIREAMWEILVNLANVEWQKRRLDMANGMEARFGGVPDYTLMENGAIIGGPRRAKSIFDHLNEDHRAMYGVVTDTGVGGAGTGGTDFNSAVAAPYATKQRLNPAAAYTNGLYQPYQGRYTSLTVNQSTNILAALRDAWLQTMYEEPEIPREGEMETSPAGAMTNRDRFQLVTSSRGIKEITSLLQASQDKLIWGNQDAGIPYPQLYGTPIRWWKRMDTVPIYNGGSDGSGTAPNTTKVTEGALQALNRGPRVMGYDCSVLYPVVLEGHFMKRRAMPPHFNIPDVWAEWFDTEWNTICEDYRKHFWVGPTGEVVADAAAY